MSEETIEIDLGNSDLANHHIEGYNHYGDPISVPLISHVKGNLYSGGCVGGVHLPVQFKYVVSLYMWEKYKLPPGCSRIEVEMYDSHEVPDEHLLRVLASTVADLAGQAPTLVHCQAGLNRSGLITALVLMELGHEPEEAISILRKQRSPLVLCNPTFENWLKTQ